MTSGMNESETCDTYITPAVQDSGWNPSNRCIIRREFSITAGRIQGPGQRGNPLRADYVLIHRNKKLAITRMIQNQNTFLLPRHMLEA